MNALASFMSAALQISPRQATRWIVERPALNSNAKSLIEQFRGRLSSANILAATDQSRLGGIVEALLAERRTHRRGPEAQRQPVPPSRMPLWHADSRITSALPAYLRAVEAFDEQGVVQPVRIPAAVVLGDNEELVGVEDPIAYLVASLGTAGDQSGGPHDLQGRTCLRVVGQQFSGRNFLAKCVAARFARDYMPGQDVRPVPLVVDFELLMASASNKTMSLTARLHEATINRDSRLPLDPTDESPLNDGALLVILLGAKEAPASDVDGRLVLDALRNASRRMLIAWHGDEELTGDGWTAGATDVRLLLSPNPLLTAASCRRAIAGEWPRCPDLKTLGDQAKTLIIPRLAGRLLGLAARGELHPAALSSGSLLSAILITAEASRSSRFPRRESRAVLPVPTDVVERLDLQLALETIKNDPAAERFRELTGGEASDHTPTLAGGFSLLRLYLGLDQWDRTPPRKIDPDGARFLADALAWALTTEVQGAITSVLDILDDSSRVLSERWGHVVGGPWESFATALGILQSVLSRATTPSAERQLATALRERALTTLRGFWLDDSIEGAANVRYHGARAAAVLITPTEMVRDLEALTILAAHDDDYAGPLAWLAELTLHVPGRLFRRGTSTDRAAGQSGSGGRAEVLAFTDGVLTALKFDELDTGASVIATALLQAVVACRARPKVTASQRHALYHAVTALARVSGPRHMRQIARELVYSVSPMERARWAVDTATVIGATWQIAGSVDSHVDLTIANLLSAIDTEIEREFGTDAPLYITQHRYLAYEALAPLLPNLERSQLLARALRGESLPRLERLIDDLAAVRYVIYYVRQELAAGVMPPGSFIKYLRDIRESLARADLLTAERRLVGDLDTIVYASGYDPGRGGVRKA